MLLGILLCIAAVSHGHLILPRAGAAAAAAANCRRTCGSSTVPYPFGFSAGCGIPLTCNSTNSILVADAYPVWNITPDSLLLDVPPSCDRPLHTAIGVLFGPNYAMTWRNGLFLRNCTASAAASRCLLPTSLVTQISRRTDLASCGEKGDNITCYSSSRTDGFLTPANATAGGCGYVFTSVLYTAAGGDEGPQQMPAIVFGAAELGWWLNGPCRCSANATCAPVALPGNATGFRCSCDAGFVGDGFADGDGCVRAAGRCGASNRKKFGDCGGRARVGLLIGGVIAGASLLLGLLLLLCSAARRRKWGASSEQTKHLLRLSEAASCPVPVYSYKDMERATNAFSDAYKLGTGAYATVYVGKLPEGLVAVKRIRCGDPSSRSSSAMNEIQLISCVRHPNLVRLLGCCVDRGEQILVYELVPNGTLAQHLRRGGVGGGLPWRARLGIAAEAARAVAYLHTALQPPIYHRDIKSTNILLDRELRPKIADFGLSRAGVAAESSHVSTAPQGTPGYLDPQYHQDFHLTDKSDVYSFGVVLVEMLTALKVVDFERPPTDVNLAALAVDRIGKGRLDEIVDPLLLLPPPADEGEGEWVMDSIRTVAELAFRCLAFHKDVRPCMTEVSEELERIRLSAPPPPPAPAPASEEEEEDVVEDVVEVLGSGSEAGERLEGRRRGRSRGMRLEEKARVDSPVSVQEVLWASEHSSSPSTNGSIPRFVL